MQKIIYWREMQKHFASRQIKWLNGTITITFLRKRKCSVDSSGKLRFMSIVVGQVLKSFLMEREDEEERNV